MITRDLILTSVFVSVGLHAAFFGASTVWQIPGTDVLVERTEKMFDIQSVEIKPPPLEQGKIVETYVEKLKFQDLGAKPQGPAVPELDQKIETPEIRAEQQKALAEAGAVILPSKEASLLKERVKQKDRPIEKEAEIELDIFQAVRSLPVDWDEEIEVPEAFRESMFAFTPEHLPAPTTATKPFFGAPILARAPVVPGGEAIDELMKIHVTTYHDPVDGQGYFRISIRPSDGAVRMEVMPKEIIFLMDASLSIQERRLDQFIRGIKYAIQNLNPGDRFNIYTFKEHIDPLSLSPLVSSESTIKQATRFLNQLEPSQQTDIYEAFLESIQNPASMRPSYILFLSDGRPTYGVTSSAKLISKISRINDRERPIFAFSGGKRVNRYLLDFLAYQNRGWSEYAAKNHDITRRISELYDKIRNPLLVNVRYQFSALDASEVYPKHLPDFYRNTEFVVYGKFQDEDRFSIRVAGEIKDRTKEFIFSKNLSEAKEGDRDIAMNWAFNKFYHLISRITLEGPDESLKQELDELRRKFGIQSPYDF